MTTLIFYPPKTTAKATASGEVYRQCGDALRGRKLRRYFVKTTAKTKNIQRILNEINNLPRFLSA
jgi:hypothetical protein